MPLFLRRYKWINIVSILLSFIQYFLGLFVIVGWKSPIYAYRKNNFALCSWGTDTICLLWKEEWFMLVEKPNWFTLIKNKKSTDLYLRGKQLICSYFILKSLFVHTSRESKYLLLSSFFKKKTNKQTRGNFKKNSFRSYSRSEATPFDTLIISW